MVSNTFMLLSFVFFVLIGKKLAILISKMIDLQCTHPDVHAAFMKGLKNRWGVDRNVHGPFH